MLICFSCVQLFVNLGIIAHQAPLTMGILQARILEWVAMPSSRGSSLTQALQCSCLENAMDREAWRATVHGVAKHRTRLSD